MLGTVDVRQINSRQINEHFIVLTAAAVTNKARDAYQLDLLAIFLDDKAKAWEGPVTDRMYST